MTLTVMIPTRSRARKIRQLIDAWQETTVLPDTTFELYVDDDDPQLADYEDIVDEHGIKMTVSPRQQLGPMMNLYAPQIAERCDVIGNIGDDHRPRTPGWDKIIAEKVLASNPSIVYGNDLYQGEKLPTAAFMSPSIIRTLGYMVPPGMIHLYLDDFWRELGNAAGILHYLPDVVIEHVHPAAGKAGWDQVYLESNTRELYNHDKALFAAYMDDQLPIDVAKLQAIG